MLCNLAWFLLYIEFEFSAYLSEKIDVNLEKKVALKCFVI